ncbi:MAG: HAD family hydrolase [Gaiellaceae bacterium]
MRWATFDCYGTLVDWNQGIQTTLISLWPEADADELLARYHEVEPRVQLGRALPYREVLRESLRLLAGHEGLDLAGDEEYALATSLPRWPVFPEVPGALGELRERGWRLGVLSNTDPDLLSSSLAAIGVPFDVAITAAEARSYKPAHGHWERFGVDTGAEGARHVHVGASPYHDLAPAAELGLAAVWINRLEEESELPRAAELPDLAGLPDVLDGLVPAGTLLE